MGCRVPQVALVLTSCSTRTQLRAAIMWFAAQTYHMLALLRWAGVQGVKWCPVVCFVLRDIRLRRIALKLGSGIKYLSG